MQLVYPVDGMACKEKKSPNLRIVLVPTMNREQLCRELIGYVTGQMAMAIICSNTMMLNGAMSCRRFIPTIEDAKKFEL